MSLNQVEIEEVVKTRIAPILGMDGGTIEVALTGVDSLVLKVRFGGTYRGSPCRGIVLKHIVFPVLKQLFCELERLELAD